MKTCPKCNESKPPAGFNKNRARADGLGVYCRECERVYRREWAAHHPERILDYNRRYVQSHPDKRREIEKNWRRRNPEKVLEQARRSRERHPEYYRAKGRRRYRQNPDLWKAHASLYDARRRGAARGRPVRPNDIAERDGWVCHLCGQAVTPETLSLDHLLPLSLGGVHEPANVALAHRSCNSRKGNRRAQFAAVAHDPGPMSPDVAALFCEAAAELALVPGKGAYLEVDGGAYLVTALPKPRGK